MKNTSKPGEADNTFMSPDEVPSLLGDATFVARAVEILTKNPAIFQGLRDAADRLHDGVDRLCDVVGEIIALDDVLRDNWRGNAWRTPRG